MHIYSNKCYYCYYRPQFLPFDQELPLPFLWWPYVYPPFDQESTLPLLWWLCVCLPFDQKFPLSLLFDSLLLFDWCTFLFLFFLFLFLPRYRTIPSGTCFFVRQRKNPWGQNLTRAWDFHWFCAYSGRACTRYTWRPYLF